MASWLPLYLHSLFTGSEESDRILLEGMLQV